MKGPVDRDLVPRITTTSSEPVLVPSGGVLSGDSQGTIVFTVPAVSMPYNLTLRPGLGATTMTSSYLGWVGTTVTSPVLSWDTAPVPAGGTAQLTLHIDAVMPSDLAVSLSSDDPANLSVPSSVVIPAGSTSVQVPVTDLSTTGGYQAGVTATLGTQSLGTTVTVLPAG